MPFEEKFCFICKIQTFANLNKTVIQELENQQNVANKII